LLCQFVRREITVALGGDGGDELFGGYDHYRRYLQRRKIFAPLERRLGRGSLRRVAAGVQNLGRMVGGEHRGGQVAALLGGREALYEYMRSHWRTELRAAPTPQWRAIRHPRCELEFAQLADATDYLPNDILVKVDRASMSTGLEVRSPFLDPEVIALAMSLPSQLRMHQGAGKPVLKEMLRSYLPADLIDRPKMGFRVPMTAWLRGKLKPIVQQLISEGLAVEGILPQSEVARVADEHLRGLANHEHKLWILIIFNEWYRSFFSRRTPAG